MEWSNIWARLLPPRAERSLIAIFLLAISPTAMARGGAANQSPIVWLVLIPLAVIFVLWLFFSAEARRMVFGYLGMIVGTVGAGAILVEVFGKQTGLTIFVAIAVLTFWIWERKK